MTASKDLISLAGKIDWQLMHGKNLDQIPSLIKQARTKLTNIEKMTEEADGQ